MDTLAELTVAAYDEAIMESFEKRIDEAKDPVEVARIVQEEIDAERDESDNFEWDKYAPDYARKRTMSLPREDQEIEGSGEPFEPPVSTEDVAGL